MSKREIRLNDSRATDQQFAHDYHTHHPANDHYFAHAPMQDRYTDYPQEPKHYPELHPDHYLDQHTDRYPEQHSDHHPADQYSDRYSDHYYEHSDNAHAEHPIKPSWSDQDLRDYSKVYPNENMHTEEVWIKESQNRISYNDADLRDVAKPHFSNMRTTITGFAGAAAMLGLIGFLAISSVPDLSPEEIIAMQGYEGEQPIKTPFNLASLRDCADANGCADSKSNTITTAAATPATATSQAALPTDELPIAQTVPVSNSSQYIEITEIPTATSMFTGASDSYESINNTYDAQQTAQDLRVTQQWSNVRSQPNADSEILTSLAIGARVTMLSQRDSWYEVFVDNAEQTIGYMHRSTVEQR